jgi:hypothetical protein
MSPTDLRAARANRVFCTDKKHIRTENAVMDKNNKDLGLLLSEIVDCARTVFRPRNIATLYSNAERD